MASRVLLLLLLLLLSSPSLSTSANITNTSEPLGGGCTNSVRCTSSPVTSLAWKEEHCVPPSIQAHRTPFLVNLVVIMIVGILGNLLTLVAFPYAWFHYSASFPFLSSTASTMVLLLHLALCDLLYCAIGLPVQTSIYLNGFFK